MRNKSVWRCLNAPGKPVRTPDQLRDQLRSRWNNQRRNWLLGGGTWPWSLTAKPPTTAMVLENWSTFDGWLRQWRTVIDIGDSRVERRTVQLGIGPQELPVAWIFDSPAAVAAELGQLERWTRAKQRFDRLAADYPHSETWRKELSSDFDLMADCLDEEFERLYSVVKWLLENPASGFYQRQLPIPGVHSKWLKGREAVVVDWLKALSPSVLQGDFHAVTGLRKPPDRLRLRLLDQDLRDALGGLSDLKLPVHEVARLCLPVRHVLIVENLYTCLSMDDLPGTMMFMGRGNAVDAFAQIPWLTALPITYWGDLDAKGFVILSRLRGLLPDTRVRSVMMDTETLHRFRTLWGKSAPHTAEEAPNLSDTEQRLLDELRQDLHGSRVQLEQERIEWDWAWSRLCAANPA
jgi:hypothetical protein